MNETRMNGMRADGTHVEQTPDDGAMADETPSDGGAGDGWDVEKARQVRLRGFLRDLIRQEGKMEAAELLGVNHKTLTRAEESGEITGRMNDALELLLRTGGRRRARTAAGGGRCAGGAVGGVGGRR